VKKKKEKNEKTMKIEINLYNNEFGKDYVSIHEQGFDAN